ncbi:hypothetical protein A3K64_04290 [Candidatus Micrarchaeota archaeon RBG_16_36_9]|nr:MAG: hypothetical protein A3K64_04290 [Candidatus Micrarchaeota archaeon RBG_16_36_9]
MVSVYFPLEQLTASIWYNFVTNFPLLLWAIIWLLIGFLVGNFGGWLVKQFLTRIKIDQYVFEKDKFKMKLSDLFAVLIRWIIYLLFILLAASYLSFVPQLTVLITSAIAFLAGAVEAAIIIIIGYSLAFYIKEQVMHSKTLYSELVGNIIFFLILYVSITLALPFVNINVQLLQWLLLIVVGAFGLGMAIAIGLGAKDIVKDITREYAKKFTNKRRR